MVTSSQWATAFLAEGPGGLGVELRRASCCCCRIPHPPALGSPRRDGELYGPIRRPGLPFPTRGGPGVVLASSHGVTRGKRTFPPPPCLQQEKKSLTLHSPPGVGGLECCCPGDPSSLEARVHPSAAGHGTAGAVPLAALQASPESCRKPRPGVAGPWHGPPQAPAARPPPQTSRASGKQWAPEPRSQAPEKGRAGRVLVTWTRPRVSPVPDRKGTGPSADLPFSSLRRC